MMTDCSCEGFAQSVKSWVAGGTFSGERKRERETVRVKWWEFRSLSHLVSFWPSGFYEWGCFAPPRISHWEGREKKKSFKVPGSVGENIGLHSCSGTKTSCADLHLKAPWRHVPGNKSDKHASARTHTRTHTLGLWWWCDARHPSSSPLPLHEVQHVLVWTCWNEWNWLIVGELKYCLMQNHCPPLRAKDWKVKRG